MNAKHYSLLHILLIFLLVISPLRSALALQLMHCKSENMADHSMMNSAVASHHVDSHAMHAASSVNMAQQACCCCDDSNQCAANCDQGVSASLLLPTTAYMPAFNAVTQSPALTTSLLIRESPPPSRPPAILHS